MTRNLTTLDATPRRGLPSTLVAFGIWLAAVVLTYLGAALAYVVLYDRFDDVTIAYKVAFCSAYVAHVALTICVSVLVAHVLRLKVCPTTIGTLCVVLVLAWPTFLVHSVLTSCELGTAYPFTRIEGCD
jgi:hypothetical protein